MAQRYSTAAVTMGHNALTRAIRHAEARDLVARNVATLVGQGSIRSHVMTLAHRRAFECLAAEDYDPLATA